MDELKDPTKEEFLAHGMEEIPEEELLASISDPNAPDGRDSCVFCLEKFSSENSTERPVRIISCSHWVGSECIQLVSSNKCPFCRARLFAKGPEPDEARDLPSLQGLPSFGNVEDLLAELALEDRDDDVDTIGSGESNGAWTLRIQVANHWQSGYLDQLASAYPQARTRHEQLAAQRAWEMEWHRTLTTHAANPEMVTAPGILPPGANLYPHPSPATTMNDTRPYALIKPFELVLPRDVAPVVDRPPLQGVWLSVRTEAVGINLRMALMSFQTLDMLLIPEPAGVEAAGSFNSLVTQQNEWNLLITQAIDAIERWCREHEAQLWRSNELEERWVATATAEIRTQTAQLGRPVPASLQRAMGTLIEFVVRWRAVREMEVWETLVTDQDQGE
ncbi:peptide synthetase [Diplodia corticola]|uniref:Peptide synthetase n=1 Tax=Diplodia corticola TaxID=236234 RepID=A0A1J9RG97_9PEZI|nr:peptide synthetase [Diplodia corticola]OJD40558.1 peptide synthetase [Diplodia corticola]